MCPSEQFVFDSRRGQYSLTFMDGRFLSMSLEAINIEREEERREKNKLVVGTQEYEKA